MRLQHNRHSVGGSNYHLLFTPKYRRQVFRVWKIRKLIEALLRRKAHGLGIRIEAIEFGPDHVHVFVTNCRKYSVSVIVNHLKGYSARHVRKALPIEVGKFYWGDSFWTDGFFYESIGRVTTETVTYYIERQQRKHWDEDELDITLRESLSKGQTTLESFDKPSSIQP